MTDEVHIADLERRIEMLEHRIEELDDRPGPMLFAGADEPHVIHGVTIQNESTKSWIGRTFIWHPGGFNP